MSRRRVHGGGAREILDRAALIGAFVIGIVGVVGLKALGAGPWLAISFPVAVLLGYVLICLAGGRLELEPETIGDNCYYLGFLFTLGSLSMSLYQMRGASAASGAEALVPVVISGFGIALSSTIAGVFLRILLLQMRPDIVALDREARRDMQAAMRDMRADISAASREFRGMAIEASQRAAEQRAEAEDGTTPDTPLNDFCAELLRIEQARSAQEARLVDAIQQLTQMLPPVERHAPTPPTAKANH